MSDQQKNAIFEKDHCPMIFLRKIIYSFPMLKFGHLGFPINK